MVTKTVRSFLEKRNNYKLEENKVAAAIRHPERHTQQKLDERGR